MSNMNVSYDDHKKEEEKHLDALLVLNQRVKE
jgi:hypothetical protein